MRINITLFIAFIFLLTACAQTQPESTATNLPQPTNTLPPATRTPRSIDATRTPRPTPTLPNNPLLDCIPADGKRTSGIVTGVVDGDTIDVTVQGLVFRIRYLGIDTPETRDPDVGFERMGKEASARNLELVKGQRVILISDPDDNETDIYGRQLRYVITGDIFVNYQLVREGLAFLFPSGIQCGS
ncbi:MAG: thermonuclease family protein, partial [Chloroflexota bacterium]